MTRFWRRSRRAAPPTAAPALPSVPRPLDEVTLHLVGGVTTGDTRTRARTAGEVTDVLRDPPEVEHATLAHVLGMVIRSERDDVCLEAEMHALLTILDHGELPPAVVEHVLTLDRATLSGSCVEYYDELLEVRDGGSPAAASGALHDDRHVVGES